MKLNRLSVLFIASLVFIYLTIALGAVTRAMGAGLGCGTDWPLCHGYLIPPHAIYEIEILLEYAHRLSALLAFLTVLTGTFLVSSVNPARDIRLWAYVTLTLVIL